MKFAGLGALCAAVGLLLPLASATAWRKVVKRSDDPEALLGVVTQHSSDINLLKAQVAELQKKIETKDPRVAFLVIFSASEVHPPASGPYHFDLIKLNDGNGYNPVDGIFTAPMRGVYVFTILIFSRGGQSARPLLDLFVNGHTVGRMAFDAENNALSHGEDSGTMSITIKLNASDEGPSADHPLLDLFVNGHSIARMAFNAEDYTQNHGYDSGTMSVVVKLNANDKVWTGSAMGQKMVYWRVYNSFFSGFLLYTE